MSCHIANHSGKMTREVRRVYMRVYMRMYREELKKKRYDPVRYPDAEAYREAVLRAIRARVLLPGHPEYEEYRGIWDDVSWQYARASRRRVWRRRGEGAWWEKGEGRIYEE